FVCMASKGPADSFGFLFRDLAQRCHIRGIPVVEVGYPNCTVATDAGPWPAGGAWDRTSLGFCEMAYVILKCRWFVGEISAPLVVASGFPCKKIAVHDGVHWDMSQAVYSDRHVYVAGYDAGRVLEHLT